MMFFWICEVPPPMIMPRLNMNWYGQSAAVLEVPRAAVERASSAEELERRARELVVQLGRGELRDRGLDARRAARAAPTVRFR